ncbi:amidohydrolase family protein [Microbacterium sp. NC79]|uniref:N-acyl-D-amino-acid deacylase family protein n=1 Tax=Microbacterium sp. NC79 TaxID=2851009 RepID=UPI001C2BD36F|nr:amidohydrolase family protein [Microbacterium sp. NC79]MBV0894588.1 amidohydrolase family protein [Microbacterium sp. NC79]
MVAHTLLSGGSVVTRDGISVADVLIDGSVIAAIGAPGTLVADTVLDCTGRFILPGLIDAHSHAEAVVFDAAVQDALLAQGITTVIGGQDGVSFAPGDGVYATEYFAAINGTHPTFTGGSVADLLATYDGTTPLNVAYAVPAGTIRAAVCGRTTEPATAEQRAAMVEMVAQGMAHGAVGLSTGLDYVPGIFQAADEIASLVAPVAAAGGVYISHMRGGYEANSAAGIHEIRDIALASGAAVHVSHFHADPPLVTALMDELTDAGVRASFDLYPYSRGCTLLGMPLLPPELSNEPVERVMAVLSDADERARLRADWFPEVDRKPSLGPEWPHMVTLAHLDSPDYAWAHGLTIAAAAERASVDAIEFTLDALLATRLRANAVMAVQSPRPDDELAEIFADPRHQGGSDGIFIGTHPHPRTRGSFARYLGTFVRELQSWTWPEAAERLAAAPAETFGLGKRGRIAEGWIADLIIVDPDRVAAGATYDDPNQLARGIDDVFVAGVAVRRAGEVTGATPGRGLRHARD